MSQFRVSDDEMRYYQFRARQRMLIQLEDHKWNEFCKAKKCSCSSCRNESFPKSIREIGIQTFQRKEPHLLKQNRGQSVKFSYPQGQGLSNSSTLSEIKDQLQRLNLKLSNVSTSQAMKNGAVSDPKNINLSNESITKKNVVGKYYSNEASSSIDEKEKRMQWIRSNLQLSLDRLQSAALARFKPGHSMRSNKDSGYILPQDLVRQRAQARKAYLASLDSRSKLKSSSSMLQNRNINKTKKASQKPGETVAKSKLPAKKKVPAKTQKSEAATTVKEESQDENITKAVDGIIDDLLGEIIVLVEKKKQTRKLSTKSIPEKTVVSETEVPVRDEQIPSLELRGAQTKWEKVKGNLANIKTLVEQQLYSPPDEKEVDKNVSPDLVTSMRDDCINPAHKEQVVTPELVRRKITVDKRVAEEAKNYRREFNKYLDRISRSKAANFDPVILSNLVTESLLDDCISDVAKEFQEVPLSLVADLYDQEFLQSI